MEQLSFSPKTGLVYEAQAPVPVLPENEVALVKVLYCGVCGTDLHIMSGTFDIRPIEEGRRRTLGHESVGVIEKLGKPSQRLTVGDRVFVNPNGTCASCKYCFKGQTNFCSLATEFCMGVGVDGAWAGKVLVPYARLHLLPEDLPMEVAALSEPFACVIRGYNNIGAVPAGTRVLIVGAGIIGVLWCILLHYRGCRRLFVSEPSSTRREFIAALGLGVQVLQPEQVPQQELFGLVVDCSGHPAAIEAAVDKLDFGGVLCAFGCSPVEAELRLKPFQLFLKEQRLVWCRTNPFTSQEAVDLVVELNAAGYLQLDKLGIQKILLKDFKSGFQTLREMKATKIVFQLNAE